MTKTIHTFIAKKDKQGRVYKNNHPYRSPPEWSKDLPKGYEGRVEVSSKGQLISYQRKMMKDKYGGKL